MDEFIISPKLNALDCINKEPVTLIYQFFIHEDKARNKEIRQCLKINVENKYIDKIILLNERIYTDNELGIKDKKIRQVNINKRLSYKDVFNHVQGDNLKGYIITSNADIFFDDTLNKIYKTELHLKKQILTPLRFDYNDKAKIKYKLFGPRADSCDTWIFHSDFNPNKLERKYMNFNFGIDCCDLKIAHILNMLGYELINDPFYIKNYHFDKPERERDVTEKINGPYLYIVPYFNREYGTEYHPASMYLSRIKKTAVDYTDNKQIFFNDKKRFNELIQDRLNNNIPLTIYRVNKELLTILYYYNILEKNQKDDDENNRKILTSRLMKNVFDFTSNHCNIKNEEFINNLIVLNKNLITNSHVILHTTPVTKIFKENIKECDNIINLSKKGGNIILNESVVSLTNRVDETLWLETIKNKTILVISENNKYISQQTQKLNELWGNRKVFENCDIYTIQAPNNEDEHQIDAMEYMKKYINFLFDRLGEKFQTIDLILIGDTIYSCFLTNLFHNNKKTVLDVGQNLELYFGLYNDNILQDYKQVIDLYKNKHWIKI